MISIPQKHWEVIVKNTACPIDPSILLGEYEDIADACLENECEIAETCKWLKEFMSGELHQ